MKFLTLAFLATSFTAALAAPAPQEKTYRPNCFPNDQYLQMNCTYYCRSYPYISGCYDACVSCWK
ncbi:hypothetical protein HK097_006661 [Rhizophlyctis rosea]|uniref:Uncharacterized protein n=1 Tax=Rhizophlyctis rosea TaxID=64517 RepID=A0AAD5SCK1_9FUNG|nr:hypothetical protein HK097_006661 [Rhizophlyctis rosea]